MEWLGAVLVIAVCIGIGWIWETAKEKDGAAGKVARGAETVSDGLGVIFRWIVAVGAIILAIVCFWFGVTKGDWRGWAAGAALIAYGIYLIRGGSVWIFF